MEDPEENIRCTFSRGPPDSKSLDLSEGLRSWGCGIGIGIGGGSVIVESRTDTQVSDGFSTRSCCGSIYLARLSIYLGKR